MTADVEFRKRVSDVVAIIDRERARVDVIEEVVRKFDAKPPGADLGLWPPYPTRKSDKTIARSLGKAFAKLEWQLNRRDAAAVLYRATSNQQDKFNSWRTELKRWRECLETFGGKRVPPGPSFLEPQTVAWPLGNKKKSTETLVRKRKAVDAAAQLLIFYGLPLTVTRISRTRGGSAFCRVAAVLYGKRKDLSYQCRAYKAQKRGAK